MCIYIYIYLYICVCVYIYIYVCTCVCSLYSHLPPHNSAWRLRMLHQQLPANPCWAVTPHSDKQVESHQETQTHHEILQSVTLWPPNHYTRDLAETSALTIEEYWRKSKASFLGLACAQMHPYSNLVYSQRTRNREHDALSLPSATSSRLGLEIWVPFHINSTGPRGGFDTWKIVDIILMYHTHLSYSLSCVTLWRLRSNSIMAYNGTPYPESQLHCQL